MDPVVKHTFEFMDVLIADWAQAWETGSSRVKIYHSPKFLGATSTLSSKSLAGYYYFSHSHTYAVECSTVEPSVKSS